MMSLTMRMMTVSGDAGNNAIYDCQSKLYDIVGRTESGKDATQLFSKLKPDFVTLDLSDVDESDLSCIDEMVELNPDVKILVVCPTTNQSIGIKALLHGASSFLQRPFSEEQFSKAVKVASTGLLL